MQVKHDRHVNHTYTEITSDKPEAFLLVVDRDGYMKIAKTNFNECYHITTFNELKPMDKIHSDALQQSIERNMVSMCIPVILDRNDTLAILIPDGIEIPIIKINDIVINPSNGRNMLSNYLAYNDDIDHNLIDIFIGMFNRLTERTSVTPSRGGVTGTRNSKFRR